MNHPTADIACGAKATMKACVISRQDTSPDGLAVVTDLDKPTEPAPSNVIVQIAYASLNPADINLMKLIPSLTPFRPHHIPGMDFSGHVVAVGSRVPAHLTVGSEVCGTLSISQIIQGVGTLVEFLELPAEIIALKPKDLPLDRSAGLGLAAQTALLLLKTRPLQAGDRVIIQGASGGVGTILVQMASASGAHVVGICSEANTQLVMSLGAKEVINHKDSAPLVDLICAEHSESFDVIFNCVGDSDLYTHSHKVLKTDGIYVDICGPGGPVVSYFRTLLTQWPFRSLWRSQTVMQYKAVNLIPSSRLMREVVEQADKGQIREVVIDSVFPIDQVSEAFQKVSSKRARGKVLVKMQ
ncbi:hypothetical protein B0I35DRAFT_444150 [Stachybotrys elegans]|uniref:Enoyl reductase (ER) domain-containing protein n=1 Tax=Stachybotrys elegans TaxID=80388 RepID=A0A8K0SFR8_9HYPO|nr:hypothetical protein B0I35DRAFT_444150 [Stachybotrys elegans]